MMTDPDVAILLGKYMRVVRGKITIDDLVSVFPDLEQRSITDASSLTEKDRRLLLDLPDEDEEAANIANVTTKTRAELLDQATSDPTSLSEDEVKLLRNNLWSELTPEESRKRSQPTSTLLKKGYDVLERAHNAILAAQASAYRSNEKAAIDSGKRENIRRLKEDALKSRKGRWGWPDSLKNVKPWVKKLQETLNTDDRNLVWGYVCYLDEYAQDLSEEEWDEIGCRMGAVLGYAKGQNGARAGPANMRWRLQMTRDGPSHAPIRDDGTVDTDAVEAYRQHYATLLSGTPRLRYPLATQPQGTGLVPGILRNTFLIFDRVAIRSIRDEDDIPDDMRILAVEYPFNPSESEPEYNGTTLVRMPQLVHNLYEQRWVHGDDEGNFEKIWKAARGCRNKAFVSLKEDEMGLYRPRVTAVSAVSRDKEA